MPAKHRVYGFCEPSTARFVDIAYVNPKVLQAIMSGLFSTESDLVETNLARSIPLYYVLECDRSPCV